ncbi:hypothetical protein V6N11_010673 [Hibiscus sabdariffa]|uniref:Uncharacterized protein n=1 Tax=Hibiscus sabdariffa TaxID=183260 RepID=A0ABR2S5Z4_9ROSI
MQGVQNDAGSIGYSSDKNNSMVVVVQAEQGHPGDDCIQNCFKKHDADNIGGNHRASKQYSLYMYTTTYVVQVQPPPFLRFQEILALSHDHEK